MRVKYSIQTNGIIEYISCGGKSNANLNRGFTQKNQISKATKRKILKATGFLEFNSKDKIHYSEKYKTSLTYKCVFITLTLSSSQFTTDKFIVDNMLQNFLQAMRDTYSMRNYVWRAEKQKNGNIHFHILSDIAVNYYTLRYVWNRIQKKFNYLKDYTEKYSNMSVQEYINEQLYLRKVKINQNLNQSKSKKRQKILNEKETISKAIQNFKLMQKQNFEQPNSVSVERLSNTKQIAYYVAKYIAKDEAEEKVNCRKFSQSNSLSALAQAVNVEQDVLKIFYDVALNYLKRKVFKDDFFTFVQIGMRSLQSLFKKEFDKYYKKVLEISNYKIFEEIKYNRRIDNMLYLFEL